MYIAFEGVKGTGKTSALHEVSRKLQRVGIEHEIICSTKSLIHSCLNLYHNIQLDGIELDQLKELKYALHSNETAITTNWELPLLLGDRSIITSYATRLWKYEDPKIHINRIEVLEPLLPAPDLIIYLETTISVLISRLKRRVGREYGKEDEEPEKLEKDIKAYTFLRENRLTPRLEKSTWEVIDADQDKEQLVENILNIIMSKLLQNDKKETKDYRGGIEAVK